MNEFGNSYSIPVSWKWKAHFAFNTYVQVEFLSQFSICMFAASSWCMLGIRFDRKISMPWRTPFMVHKRMSQQLWMVGIDWVGAIYHLILAWHGNRSLDRKLWNLSFEISRSLWRDGCSGELGLQPHCFADILNANGSSGNCIHISLVRLVCLRRTGVHLHFRAWNERIAIWGGREDARDEHLESWN